MHYCTSVVGNRPKYNSRFCPCLSHYHSSRHPSSQQAPVLPFTLLILLALLRPAILVLVVANAKVVPRCRKLSLNNKKVQQAVVDVDGGLELLQASGFELVFDESSPEPQASAAPMPTTGTPPQGLACSETQSRADLPIQEASLKGTTSAESAGQGTPTAAVGAAQTEVSNKWRHI